MPSVRELSAALLQQSQATMQSQTKKGPPVRASSKATSKHARPSSPSRVASSAVLGGRLGGGLPSSMQRNVSMDISTAAHPLTPRSRRRQSRRSSLLFRVGSSEEATPSTGWQASRRPGAIRRHKTVLTSTEVQLARDIFREAGGVQTEQEPITALTGLLCRLYLAVVPTPSELRAYLSQLDPLFAHDSADTKRPSYGCTSSSEFILDVETFLDVLELHKRHFLCKRHMSDEVWMTFLNLRSEVNWEEDAPGELDGGGVPANRSAGGSSPFGDGSVANAVSLHRMQEIMHSFGLTFDVHSFYKQACNVTHPSQGIDYEAFRYCCGNEDLDIASLFHTLGGNDDLSGTVPAARVLQDTYYFSCMTPEQLSLLLRESDIPLDGTLDFNQIFALAVRVRREVKQLQQQQTSETASTTPNFTPSTVSLPLSMTTAASRFQASSRLGGHASTPPEMVLSQPRPTDEREDRDAKLGFSQTTAVNGSNELLPRTNSTMHYSPTLEGELSLQPEYTSTAPLHDARRMNEHAYHTGLLYDSTAMMDYPNPAAASPSTYSTTMGLSHPTPPSNALGHGGGVTSTALANRLQAQLDKIDEHMTSTISRLKRSVPLNAKVVPSGTNASGAGAAHRTGPPAHPSTVRMKRPSHDSTEKKEDKLRWAHRPPFDARVHHRNPRNASSHSTARGSKEQSPFLIGTGTGAGSRLRTSHQDPRSSSSGPAERSVHNVDLYRSILGPHYVDRVLANEQDHAISTMRQRLRMRPCCHSIGACNHSKKCFLTSFP